MAERRMFAKTIIDSDAFLDMPQSSQLLYFHLAMRADDDGFINNPKAIMRNCNCSEDDLKLLAIKKFIIPFETGVVVIKHWKIHNYIRNDRYKETKYKEEKSLLLLDENNSYTACALPSDNQMDTVGIPSDNQMDTQVRLGEVSLIEDNINTMCNSDESHDKKKASKTDIDNFFNGLWSLYPVKKGKGQVSAAKRKTLYEIGEPEMHRAIHRYLTELKKDESWRKPQNGSTFFNSGYIDYLDANYEPQTVRAGQSNKTADMLNESYDMMDEWAKTTEGMN